ncbi:MAG: YggS family pyridoxal phosphate-dependent enzyme [Clostridia bacterium]|nr:YggS family pyridoxal phosphate-dependent enzyme [Clostridia bacterium]MBQ6614449.1 YggS family pyridoxal phosphate-dependent enzyme [Clostridia bacterium]
MNEFEYIDRNLEIIRAKAEDAAKVSPHKQSFDILLATKYASAEEINYAHSKGINKIGENRVQSLLEKYDRLNKDDLDIHFIGTLQKNKVKYIIDKVSMIESLDSVELAKEIEKQAAKRDIVMDCLIEVNIGDEEAKSGISKQEVLAFADELDSFPHIRLCGLMTMAPKCEKIDEYRKYFRESYDIFIDICEKKLHNVDRRILSMGMSESFDAALMEGANLIRVGRAAFAK